VTAAGAAAPPAAAPPAAAPAAKRASKGGDDWQASLMSSLSSEFKKT
jgi:hypothetical protein